VVLAVGLLLLVVAVASRPPDQAGGAAPAVATAAGRVLIDSLFYLFIVVEALGLVLIVWGLWPDGRPRTGPPPRRRPWWQGPMAALMVVVTTFVLIRLIALRGNQGRQPLFGALRPPGATAGQPGSQLGAGGVDWIAVALVALLLTIVALVLWRLLRASTGMLPPRERLTAAVERLLDDAIDAALDERDARRAVIAAWERLEAVLATAGVERRRWEAPHELVDRVLEQIALPAAGMRRLAELYEWARFSTHEVSQGMRDTALACLIEVRDDVRAQRQAAAARQEPAGAS
jgi:uncharacterized protein DUF4129